jgi:hypothetical protein
MPLQGLFRVASTSSWWNSSFPGRAFFSFAYPRFDHVRAQLVPRMPRALEQVPLETKSRHPGLNVETAAPLETEKSLQKASNQIGRFAAYVHRKWIVLRGVVVSRFGPNPDPSTVQCRSLFRSIST